MIKHVPNRIIVKVDLKQKNGVTFEDGTEIELVRDVDNFDRKYTQQVLGEVIDAENIPLGALLLFHHNALHETYEVFNHSVLSGKESISNIKIFSIMERDCFFWKMPKEEKWNPTKNYATALRVFEPYTGTIEGIKPTLIKDILYVTSGEFTGNVVQTIKASDYQITFRNEKGIDENIIRFRPTGIKEDQREPEAICVLDDVTDQVINGTLFIGLTDKDCKELNFPIVKKEIKGMLKFKSITVL